MTEELTPQQSLDIIQRSINDAKESFVKISPFFLVWGIVFVIAGLVEFYLKYVGHELFWISWPVAAAIGGALVGFVGFKAGKTNAGNVSFIDRMNTFLWGSYGVALMLVLYITLSSGVDPNPFVMLLTGIPTFVTGALMRFKPMKFGALAFWAGAVVAINVDTMYSGLIFSIALVIGYLIPGILLKGK